MSRSRIAFLVLAGASALAVSGCALFQASPSATTCAQTQAALTSAGVALTAANSVLASDQAILAANPKDAVKAAKVQADENDVAIAQAALASFQALVASKCAPLPPPAPAPAPAVVAKS